LGFFFLSFACFLAATSADLLEELRNPARAAAGASAAAATAGERDTERETKLLHGRPGWLRKDEARPRAPGLARSSSAGARARSGGRTGGAGGVWDPVPGNWNQQQQQRVSGTNPPAQ